MINLPNLELLEYIAKAKIRKDSTIYNKIIAYCNSIGMSGRSANFDLCCTMFVQDWPTTSTAFGKYGTPIKTAAYTTIFFEHISGAYVVFVDNKYCYTLPKANDAFAEDMKEHTIASANDSKKRYYDDTNDKKKRGRVK